MCTWAKTRQKYISPHHGEGSCSPAAATDVFQPQQFKPSIPAAQQPITMPLSYNHSGDDPTSWASCAEHTSKTFQVVLTPCHIRNSSNVRAAEQVKCFVCFSGMSLQPCYALHVYSPCQWDHACHAHFLACHTACNCWLRPFSPMLTTLAATLENHCLLPHVLSMKSFSQRKHC